MTTLSVIPWGGTSPPQTMNTGTHIRRLPSQAPPDLPFRIGSHAINLRGRWPRSRRHHARCDPLSLTHDIPVHAEPRHPQIRGGLVERLLDAQPLQPVHQYARKLSRRETRPGIQRDLLDLLSLRHSVHPLHDHKPTEDREVPPFPGPAEAAEFRAIDLDARPRIPASLPIDEGPQERQALFQKPREQFPLHPIDPLPGFRRLLHVTADFSSRVWALRKARSCETIMALGLREDGLVFTHTLPFSGAQIFFIRWHCMHAVAHARDNNAETTASPPGTGEICELRSIG